MTSAGMSLASKARADITGTSPRSQGPKIDSGVRTSASMFAGPINGVATHSPPSMAAHEIRTRTTVTRG